MQFVPNGPNVPEELLQAHEEGRVVFFCGAGISYPAGLPGFRGLVDKIYKANGTKPSELEKEVYDRAQYDAALDLLERRLPGQRMAVRKALAKALRPNLRRKGAVDTHIALLRLSRCHDGSQRLVTTNFDRVFDAAAKQIKQSVHTYSAPMLPIPKNSRWNGLVYLHGRLPENTDGTALNRLVVTSGDFGIAYLTERWAARFVSELLRNYVVCFVGYSINDPVLRYMMDALAADRMLGETTPQAWAFGDCVAGQEHRKTVEWAAKGVMPILYHVPPSGHDHSLLHRTLQGWSEIYRDGVTGKERVVVSHALARPSGSTVQDDFVGRMLWALSDESGLPAKQFAEFNPVPTLDWLLEAFSEARYTHNDLSRFGVPPQHQLDRKLRFSLVRRPAPYHFAPQMALVSFETSGSKWDAVMFQLAKWLTRHLNDPRLILWLAQQGGSVHEQFLSLAESELDRIDRLRAEGKTAELAEIATNAPNSIPGRLMRSLWRLLINRRVKSQALEPDLYQWAKRLRSEGLTTSLKLELRDSLAPKFKISKAFQWSENDEPSDENDRVRQLIDWKLVLSADHVQPTIRELADDKWKTVLPLLLDDFQLLLRDALDLLRELGNADDHSDPSCWDLPSVSPHWQNRGFADWVSLIEMLRDAWLALRTTDEERASRIAIAWFAIPYPTFKRLSLFAASKDNNLTPKLWVKWLLVDDSWWLWSVKTQREALRLLALQGSRLAEEAQNLLETAILAGPPRVMFRDDLNQEDWTRLVARSTWLRLAKLASSGLALGPIAFNRLRELSRDHPGWHLEVDERDEFPHWLSGTGDPDYENNRDVEDAPRNWQDLVSWLKKAPPKGRPFYEDTWRIVCETRFFHALRALKVLADEGIWPAQRWQEALQAWSEAAILGRSWRYAARVVLDIPDLYMREIVRSVSWWLEAVSKLPNLNDEVLLALIQRVMDISLETDSTIVLEGGHPSQPVTEAINHPVGHITQGLINVWLNRKPNDNDLLPSDIRKFFTELSNIATLRYRHGRVILASQLIALFRVDRIWTITYMLPLFNWANPIIAREVWEGFLWSPRIYQPLLVEMKGQLLETTSHYRELGQHSKQFAAFITYTALEVRQGFTLDEFQAAIEELPLEGLEESAQALAQALEGAAGQREEYWTNRVVPFWTVAWPKSVDLANQRIAQSLFRLSIAAGSKFPEALDTVLGWLRNLDHPGYIVHKLHEQELCYRFPSDALKLLDILIDSQSWAPRELKSCLDQITRSESKLEDDPRYKRLRQYVRSHAD